MQSACWKVPIKRIFEVHSSASRPVIQRSLPKHLRALSELFRQGPERHCVHRDGEKSAGLPDIAQRIVRRLGELNVDDDTATLLSSTLAATIGRPLAPERASISSRAAHVAGLAA